MLVLLRSVAALVLLAIATVLPFEAPAVSQDAEPCTQPYSPVYFQSTYSRMDPPPAIDGSPVATTIPNLFVVPDLDGDGAPDRVDGPGAGQVTITRPGGNVTFARAAERLDVLDAGDLGGGAEHDMWVIVYGPPEGPVVTDAYLVAYDVPAGTYDPADVGTRVPPGSAIPSEDRNGDGEADVFVVQSDTIRARDGTTLLFSGAELLAAGAPGDARDVDPLAPIEGALQAFVDFGVALPAVITAEEGEDALRVWVFDGSTTTAFTSAPSLLLADDITFPSLFAYAGSGGRFFGAARGSRSGAGSYYWSLDNPCQALVPATALPVSPPASAVESTPSFTG